MVEIWIVQGYQALANDHEEPALIYEHAFGSKEEAQSLLAKAEHKYGEIYWTMGRMNYGQMDYAQYLIEMLAIKNKGECEEEIK